MAWIDGYNNTDFISFAGDNTFEEPYPAGLWRCDPEYYNGYPFNTLFPDIDDFHFTAAKQQPYICVYDISTPKNSFDNNGIAILLPSECETTEDLNGMWSATLTHPLDQEARWSNVLQNNILKINGQLFTIKTCEANRQGSERYVSCYAEHIWYQQADGWCFPNQYIWGQTGEEALENIKSATYYHADPEAHEVIYDFQGHSDIEYLVPWVVLLNDGSTPIDLILGDDGFIAQKGGELFRDNFYYSVNERKEDARDDAFDIRIGKNLTGIIRTIDTTNFASYFRVYDDFGGWWASAWVMSEEIQRQFPHHVVRSMKADKPYNANDESFDYDAYFNGVVIGQGEAWFKSHCKPIICYDIELEDITNNPDFEICSDERYVPGDKGRLFDPFLGSKPVDVEITSVTRNEITGKTKKIVVGEQTGFTRPASPPVLLGLDTESQGGEYWVTDAENVFCLDADGVKIFVEVD